MHLEENNKIIHNREWSPSLPNKGLVFKHSTSKSNWNLEVLVFMGGGKPENPEKNPRSKVRTNNKLNPHETLSKGIALG